MGTAFVFLVLLFVASQIWTEKLWFDSVGYTSVWTKEWLVKIGLFLAGAVVTALIFIATMVVAYRNRPLYASLLDPADPLSKYRRSVEPFRRVIFVAVPAFMAVVMGISLASEWKTLLLWWHATPFGSTDPYFHLDIGFYIFTLPAVKVLTSLLTGIMLVALIVAGVIHYFYGGLRTGEAGANSTNAARVHLSVMAALYVLARGLEMWWSRYDLALESNRLFTGMNYAADNARLPAVTILVVASVVCAGLFVSTIWLRSWRLPGIGVAMMLVTSIVAGTLYPALVQRFRVKPSEQSLEAPFITKAIASTRTAYGLDDIQVTEYSGTSKLKDAQLRQEAKGLTGIRLLDPSVVSPTFRQLQGRVNFYQFGDVLDVGRYKVGGQTNDAVLGVRELSLKGLPSSQRNWVNDHLVYTHGYGVVAAYGNKQTADGAPKFFERNMPSTGELGKYEPRIYFGEHFDTFSIVGGAGDKREYDYPDSNAGGEKRTTYTGTGGVKLDSLPRRLAYALFFADYNVLLSSDVTEKSRILYVRNPQQRVQNVAPWLKLDGDPYPAVVDEKVVWILDGYTTSANYPGAQKVPFGTATSDSTTRTKEAVASQSGGDINYIRNSVKATVDAYTGEVKLFAWDEKDPMLKAWMSAFPGTVQPRTKIPGSLMEALRYPADLFKVQRHVLARYHVNQAQAFFQGNDAWQVTSDPTVENNTQPPYYLTLQMPGQKTPVYSLTSTFIPVGERQNVTGFLSVDADAGSSTGKPRSGYGRLRLLEMPGSSTVLGPGQFQNELESSTENEAGVGISLTQFLTQARRAGSSVDMGNLFTVPMGGSFLYVEPIYIKASGANAYPNQRAVVVSFGKKLAWAPTLSEALDTLFGKATSQPQSDDSKPSAAPPADDGKSSEKPKTPTAGADNAALQSALQRMKAAYEKGQAALQRGDLEAYGAAQKELKKALDDALKASPTGKLETP